MPNRRQFLKSAAGLALGSQLIPSFAGRLSADDRNVVQLSPEIEPLARLIEDTPRDKVFEAVATRLHDGVSYRQFLAALYLAGVRNVNPQPPGFKFHCVFVIHAAHQMSLDGRVQDRLLPLFQALDYFKDSQQRDVREGDFELRPVTGRLPEGDAALKEFHDAMQSWDEERADRAITALVRSSSAHQIIGGLWQYGARDYRNIGHKSVFVANTWRTLQTIGWQHAEPALRSLVLGLLDFGPNERVNEFAFEDQCWLSNHRRSVDFSLSLHEALRSRESQRGVTIDLLKTLREAAPDECCKAAADLLTKGQATGQAIWDAVHLAAGELMMRQPGIYGIHTVTSSGGLRYAFEQATDPTTRGLLLLQGVGWMAQFRHFMATKRGGLQDTDIVSFSDAPEWKDRVTNADISQQIGQDIKQASTLAAAYAVQHGSDLSAFRSATARSVTHKKSDAHHYKYASAILEDYGRVSPEWRPHLLAASVYYRPGDNAPESPTAGRAQALLFGQTRKYLRTQRGRGDVIKPPRFRDRSGGDFRLAMGSPAINAGETSKLVVDDASGLGRPLHGANEIGAFEFPEKSGSVRILDWQELAAGR